MKNKTKVRKGINVKLSRYIIKENDKFKIPDFNFKKFSYWHFRKKNKKYSEIKYNTLMRFYLYYALLRYKGDNEIILEYIKDLKNKNEETVEIINKIPNNNMVMDYIIKKYNFDMPIINTYSNLEKLKQIINNYKEIFSEENIEIFFNKAEKTTKKSDFSEKVISGLLKMLYSKRYLIKDPLDDEYLEGVDNWLIDKKSGDRKAVQIKYISKHAKLNIVGDSVIINNTYIDLHDYKTTSGINLPYDYLILFVEKDKRACLIKSNAIFSINRHRKNIKIKIDDWAMDEKYKKFVFRDLFIPSKLLPTDNSNIFY